MSVLTVSMVYLVQLDVGWDYFESDALDSTEITGVCFRRKGVHMCAAMRNLRKVPLRMWG